jgi:hypothetical protein
MSQAVALDLKDTQRIFDYLSKSVADPSARREFEIYLAGAFHGVLAERAWSRFGNWGNSVLSYATDDAISPLFP